jgi:hypothetical protein
VGSATVRVTEAAGLGPLLLKVAVKLPVAWL